MRVGQLKLNVRDMDEAVRFYERAFGMTWVPDIGSFQFGTYSSTQFFLLSVEENCDDHPGPPGTSHFGLIVANVDAAHRRALDAGAFEWYAPHDNVGMARSSGLDDPSGNRIELYLADDGVL